jgi:predicted esterase
MASALADTFSFPRAFSYTRRMTSTPVRALLIGCVSSLILSACGGSDDSPVPIPIPTAPTSPDQVDRCATTLHAEATAPNRPVITLTGAPVVELALGATYTDAGATARDPRYGDITSSMLVSNDVTTATAGDYLVRYNVYDALGLPATEVVRVVRVKDASGNFALESKRDMFNTTADLGYFEHLPTNYSDPNKVFPLIVWNHGSGESVRDDDRYGDPLGSITNPTTGTLSETPMSLYLTSGTWDTSRPFIVISAQQCMDDYQNGLAIPKKQAFIDYLKRTYKVDETHIYMMGHSLGAFEVYDYIQANPTQLAAGVPISGDMQTGSDACLLKTTPTWAFHGEVDGSVPFSSDVATQTAIAACTTTMSTAPHRFTAFVNQGHSIPLDVLERNTTTLGTQDPAYDPYNQDLFAWLLTFSRAQ